MNFEINFELNILRHPDTAPIGWFIKTACQLRLTFTMWPPWWRRVLHYNTPGLFLTGNLLTGGRL